MVQSKPTFMGDGTKMHYLMIEIQRENLSKPNPFISFSYPIILSLMVM